MAEITWQLVMTVDSSRSKFNIVFFCILFEHTHNLCDQSLKIISSAIKRKSNFKAVQKDHSNKI